MSCAGTSRLESVGEGKQGSEWVKRSLRGSLLGFPMNLDALPDEILAWCWRRLLGRRLALGSAQRRHSSRGRRGHPATVTGRGRRWQAGRWNTHGVFFRWGGAGLGLREDDAFFFAGVRRVATMVRSGQLGWWRGGVLRSDGPGFPNSNGHLLSVSHLMYIFAQSTRPVKIVCSSSHAQVEQSHLHPAGSAFIAW
jgi:hypothetical protein